MSAEAVARAERAIRDGQEAEYRRALYELTAAELTRIFAFREGYAARARQEADEPAPRRCRGSPVTDPRGGEPATDAEQSHTPTMPTPVPDGMTAYVQVAAPTVVDDSGGDRYPVTDEDGDTGGTLWEGAIAVSYREGTRRAHGNDVSRVTGSEWTHERLAQTRRGRYYVTTDSQWQGSSPSARVVTVEEAGHWLARAGYDSDDRDVARYSPALARALREAMEDA